MDPCEPCSCYCTAYKKWSKERNQKRVEAAKATKKRKSEAATTGAPDDTGVAAAAEVVPLEAAGTEAVAME